MHRHAYLNQASIKQSHKCVQSALVQRPGKFIFYPSFPWSPNNCCPRKAIWGRDQTKGREKKQPIDELRKFRSAFNTQRNIELI